MKGYLANPEKTRETIDPEGFVRTGDIGYYDDDGVVYVVGRSKDIIKYKSFQVSPVELENILVKHPQVKDAVVVGKTDRKCGEVPVAFVVREVGGTATEEEICDFVAGFVSAEKRLHGGVRFVEAIPKNITGKVSRKELTRRVEEIDFKSHSPPEITPRQKEAEIVSGQPAQTSSWCHRVYGGRQLPEDEEQMQRRWTRDGQGRDFTMIPSRRRTCCSRKLNRGRLLCCNKLGEQTARRR
ncbi:hypothetical protein GEV33_000733 [Tenebrio molitor]|uniref:AMP-binding enzyme C-terminal domain-containing protein n=1 Tax=Tenebrio molitor TaxID=7067 RepID=A0A8J6HXW3_TENMO|nr:hypothetical protein GEV33_000733 [Tenebrio molitor]